MKGVHWTPFTVHISRNVVDVKCAVSVVYLSSGNLLKPHTAWNGKRHAENLLTVRKEDNEESDTVGSDHKMGD